MRLREFRDFQGHPHTGLPSLILFSLPSLSLWPMPSGPTIPSGVVAYVPIGLTNSQSSAVAGGTQIMLNVDWSSYSAYLNAQASNVVFFDSAGNSLNAWMETFVSTSDVADVVWVQLNSTGIPASSTRTIYMGFYSTSTNNFNPNGNWGEAPTITATYGQYDNGAQVFTFYDDFAGTSINSAWNTTELREPTRSTTVLPYTRPRFQALRSPSLATTLVRLSSTPIRKVPREHG